MYHVVVSSTTLNKTGKLGESLKNIKTGENSSLIVPESKIDSSKKKNRGSLIYQLEHNKNV